jgi:hypothetical protein
MGGFVVRVLRHTLVGAGSSASRAFAVVGELRDALMRSGQPLCGDVSADVGTSLDRSRGRALGSRGGQTPFEIGRPDADPIVGYEAFARRWSMWWPCEACGGVKLALRGRADADGSSSIPSLAGIVDQPCPGCEARRQRRSSAGEEPAVWYDTSLGDWVLWLPGTGPRDGTLLPLEIPWFDAPWSDVYRAASDLAFGGDAFASGWRREPPQTGRGHDV